MRTKPLILLTIISTLSCFILAGVLLGIGKSTQVQCYSTVAVSVPLFPCTPDGLGLFAGVSLLSNSTSGFCSSPLPATLSIEFSLGELVKPDLPQDIYFLHNLWGYDINFTLLDGSNESVLTFGDSRNVDGSKEADVVRPAEQWAVPEWARFESEMYVKCPTNHTLITEEEEIEPGCAVLGGALVPIGEHLEALKTGSVTWENPVPPVRFVFHKLAGYPMDFVDTPRMYITSWSEPLSLIFIMGVVCLILAFFSPVIFLMIYGCC
jgi:hypothetical protein